MQCTVCLEDFDKGVKIGRLLCGHIFHKECIEVWINKNRTCPVCRTYL